MFETVMGNYGKKRRKEEHSPYSTEYVDCSRYSAVHCCQRSTNVGPLIRTLFSQFPRDRSLWPIFLAQKVCTTRNIEMQILRLICLEKKFWFFLAQTFFVDSLYDRTF